MPLRVLLVDPSGRIVVREDEDRAGDGAPRWRIHLVEMSGQSLPGTMDQVRPPQGATTAHGDTTPSGAGGAQDVGGGRERDPELTPRVPEGDAALPLALLGVDDGTAVCLGLAGPEPSSVPGGQWRGMREVGARLSGSDRALALEALALSNWHRSHTHCPACGAATEPDGLGWWRRCPADGTEHYPRTDPAVIATLTDDAGNILLARQRRWPQGAFSTLAGFVEPGERAESAVAREIHEEVSLLVTSATYVDSQPWPFPSSLMLGFHARTPGVRPQPTVDGLEIAEALWIARDELPGLCEAGTVRLPGRLSIAHRLIASWYGAELADAWCRW